MLSITVKEFGKVKSTMISVCSKFDRKDQGATLICIYRMAKAKKR